MAVSKASQAYALFSEGKGPSDPAVKALGIKGRTRQRYYQRWKDKVGRENIVEDDPVDLDALEKALAPKDNGDEHRIHPQRIPASHVGKPKATSLQDAVYVTVQPKAFTMTSSILWQAMNAAINEWGWPKDITPEHFLDAYLYISFKQRGVLLRPYVVLTYEEGGNGSKPDGDNEV